MRAYYVYIMASRSRVLYTGVTNDLARVRAQAQPHPRLHEQVPHQAAGLLRGVWRCARRHRPRKAAQGLGSLTKDAVDRTEKPHMGGLGGHLVRGTRSRSFAPAALNSGSFAPPALRMTGSFAPG